MRGFATLSIKVVLMRGFVTLSLKVALIKSFLCVPWVMTLQVKRVCIKTLHGIVEAKQHVPWIAIVQVFCLIEKRLFYKIECIRILDFREIFQELIIVSFVKISGLICEVMDIGSKGRTTLIFWCFFALLICLICVGGENFPNNWY